MSKKLAAINYFEPWDTTKSRAHGLPPNTDGMPEDIALAIREQWERRDEHAPWHIWASNMAEKVEVTGFLGSKVVMDDRRIIATLYELQGICPGHDMFAKRIVACVNAMQGVLDPDHFVRYAKELMVQKAKERR